MLIFVKNIPNYICGEKIVMWRNLGKIWEILEKFWEILGDLRAFLWRKIDPKKYICGDKMTNMRSEWELNTAALPLRSPVFA